VTAVNEVVETIAIQVRHQLPMQGVKLIAIDERTLRVSFAGQEQGRCYRNIDISYNYGQDLYDVLIHTIDRQTLEHETETLDGIYCDQFADLLANRQLVA
jgi:hypothetical protein